MHDDHGGMEMDFDLMYIDMMILHHGSIIALAETDSFEIEVTRSGTDVLIVETIRP